jgi:hypothetical protein
LGYILLDIVAFNNGCYKSAHKLHPDVNCVDSIFSFHRHPELYGALIVFVDSRLDYLANGWFNASEEYIEESFALNLPYLSFVVVGDTYRAGHLLINKNVFSLNS